MSQSEGIMRWGGIRRLGMFLIGSRFAIGRKSFICCDGKSEGSQPCSRRGQTISELHL